MQLDFNKMFARSKYHASIWTMEVTTASVSFQTKSLLLCSKLWSAPISSIFVGFGSKLVCSYILTRCLHPPNSMSLSGLWRSQWPQNRKFLYHLKPKYCIYRTDLITECDEVTSSTWPFTTDITGWGMPVASYPKLVFFNCFRPFLHNRFAFPDHTIILAHSLDHIGKQVSAKLDGRVLIHRSMCYFVFKC